MKKISRTLCSIVLALAILVTLSSCQKSPDSSLVVNKGLDKLIEEANTPNTEKVDIKDIDEVAYENYVTAFEDIDLGVKVNVDAKVDIPKSDHLAVFRVKQVKFTQEFIDIVRTELMGNCEIYDGAALDQRHNPGFDITSFASDGKLHTNEEMYQKYPGHYAREYEYNPTGDSYYVINDGSDGRFFRLSVNHSENNGNTLAFYASRYNYSFPMGSNAIDADRYNNDTIPDHLVTDVWITPDIKFTPTPGETCELSVEEAVKIADDLLASLGLEEFEFYSDSFANMHTGYGSDNLSNKLYYSPRIYLTYYRNIDGVLLTQSSGVKNNMSVDHGATTSFTKKTWRGEEITVAVNDSGIVEFKYDSPIEITETVVENAAIRSFESVRDTFEKMMIVTKASEEYLRVYDIDRVRLSYSRISEPDSYDTGLIVPVWDFSGHIVVSFDGTIAIDENDTALAINAIDGSIINRDLGY